MMELVYLFVGVLLGALIAWLFARSRFSASQTALQMISDQQENQRSQYEARLTETEHRSRQQIEEQRTQYEARLAEAEQRCRQQIEEQRTLRLNNVAASKSRSSARNMNVKNQLTNSGIMSSLWRYARLKSAASRHKPNSSASR